MPLFATRKSMKWCRKSAGQPLFVDICTSQMTNLGLLEGTGRWRLLVRAVPHRVVVLAQTASGELMTHTGVRKKIEKSFPNVGSMCPQISSQLSMCLVIHFLGALLGMKRWAHRQQTPSARCIPGHSQWWSRCPVGHPWHRELLYDSKCWDWTTDIGIYLTIIMYNYTNL